MDKKLLVISVSIVLGLYLLSNPRCNGGCKTVAQHLLFHDGLDGLLGVLA